MTTPTPTLRAILATGATLIGLGGVLLLSPAGQSLIAAQQSDAPDPQSAGSTEPTQSDADAAQSETNAQSASASPTAVEDEPEPVVEEPAPVGAADGTYTGYAYDTPYGAMQVEVVISGGSIADVYWVQLPQDQRSLRINDQAAPILVAEALEAQSASVDSVSGASFTSEGFRQSLQSALDEAGYAS